MDLTDAAITDVIIDRIIKETPSGGWTNISTFGCLAMRIIMKSGNRKIVAARLPELLETMAASSSASKEILKDLQTHGYSPAQ